MCQIDAVDLEVRKVTIILILEFSGLIYKHNELNILVVDMCFRASSVIYIVLCQLKIQIHSGRLFFLSNHAGFTQLQ